MGKWRVEVMINYPIIGIVGMPGSGKSVLTQKFNDKGWASVYFGSVTLNELDKRNLEYNQINEKSVREELRNEYGEDAYAKILMPEINELAQKGPIVLDGLYSWSEYKHLKSIFNKQLKLIAVVTDSPLRYTRLQNRIKRPLSKEESIKRDFAEIERLEKGGPIAIADYYITNNSNINEFYDKFEEIFEKLLD